MNHDLWESTVLKRAREGFNECSIPVHMQSGVELYLTHGVEPGSFLLSVLANDFKGACIRADYTNVKLLKNWALFVINYLPKDCWGSRAKVDCWIGVCKLNQQDKFMTKNAELIL